MTVLKYVFSYFKDFDRNFQNNYYFVLFPSIQFLNNTRQLRLTYLLKQAFRLRQPTHNNTVCFLCQAFFKSFLKIFYFFLIFFLNRKILCILRFWTPIYAIHVLKKF